MTCRRSVDALTSGRGALLMQNSKRLQGMCTGEKPWTSLQILDTCLGDVLAAEALHSRRLS